MLSPQSINWIGILAAAFAVMMLGWVWFAVLFARAYAAVLDRPYEPGAKMPPLYIVGPSLCMLVATIASAWLMRALGIATLGGAVGFGLLVGVCYLGSTAVNMVINPLVPRPLAYGFLSASYFVVASAPPGALEASPLERFQDIDGEPSGCRMISATTRAAASTQPGSTIV